MKRRQIFRWILRIFCLLLLVALLCGCVALLVINYTGGFASAESYNPNYYSYRAIMSSPLEHLQLTNTFNSVGFTYAYPINAQPRTDITYSRDDMDNDILVIEFNYLRNVVASGLPRYIPDVVQYQFKWSDFDKMVTPSISISNYTNSFIVTPIELRTNNLLSSGLTITQSNVRLNFEQSLVLQNNPKFIITQYYFAPNDSGVLNMYIGFGIVTNVDGKPQKIDQLGTISAEWSIVPNWDTSHPFTSADYIVNNIRYDSLAYIQLPHVYNDSVHAYIDGVGHSYGLGYSNGYADGVAYGNSVGVAFPVGRQIIRAVYEIVNVPLFGPYFSVGTLISIVVTLSIVFLIIRFVRG